MSDLQMVDDSIYLEVFVDDYDRYAAFCKLYRVSMMDGLSLLMDMAGLGSAKEIREASENVVEFAFGNVGDRSAEAIAELSRRADAGEYLALIELAAAYTDQETLHNLDLAYQYACRAAETGNTEALCLAGKIAYLSGRYDAAFSWFERGAALKNTDCEFMVGACYLLGLGCEVDGGKAMVMLNRVYKTEGDVDGLSEVIEAIYRRASELAEGKEK